MKTTIRDLLPEELSDEGAYHLINFFMNLALELESYYFAQIRRYVNNDMMNRSDSFQNEPDDKLPF
jgi:hypothetical protein